MEARKKLLLIGANGLVGKHLCKRLIKEYHVIALIRSPPSFGINSIYLKFVQGDALNQESLQNAIKGVDIVVSAFGIRNKQQINEPVYQHQKLVTLLIKVMQRNNIKRVITVFGAGSLDQAQLKVKFISDDHYQAYLLLKNSKLQWTSIHPPLILDQNDDGSGFQLYEEITPKQYKTSIKAGQIATCILNELRENKHIGKRVGIFQK